jgi:hypothetical protein
MCLECGLNGKIKRVDIWVKSNYYSEYEEYSLSNRFCSCSQPREETRKSVIVQHIWKRGCLRCKVKRSRENSRVTLNEEDGLARRWSVAAVQEDEVPFLFMFPIL